MVCLQIRYCQHKEIFDRLRRSSVAYGTPPQLRKSQSDIRAASLSNLGRSHDENIRAAVPPVFLGLATLTVILDDYLEEVFDLQQRFSSKISKGRDLDEKITKWEASLPEDLKRCVVLGTDMHLCGSSNLRLAYLYLRLLSRKLVLDDKENCSRGPSGLASPTDMHSRVRQAAEEIVRFIQNLDNTSLCDFWLPSSAFALSNTVASLLRCALETEWDLTCLELSPSLKLAQDLIVALKGHRKHTGWDVGNICLVQYSEVLEKMMSMNMPSLDAVLDLESFITLDLCRLDEADLGLWEWFEGQ
jgi:hypothetical protein